MSPTANATTDRSAMMKNTGSSTMPILSPFRFKSGINGFTANVLAGNTGMVKVFQKSGCIIHTDYESGELYLSFRFDEKAESQ